MSLANPGMLTEYEGPSRSSSRRSRGTVVSSCFVCLLCVLL